MGVNDLIFGVVNEKEGYLKIKTRFNPFTLLDSNRKRISLRLDSGDGMSNKKKEESYYSPDWVGK